MPVPLKKLRAVYTPATTAKRPDEKQNASRVCNFEKDSTPQWHPVLPQYERHYYTSPVGRDSDSKVLVRRKAAHLWRGAMPPRVTIVTSHLHLTWPTSSAAAVRHVVVLVCIVPERQELSISTVPVLQSLCRRHHPLNIPALGTKRFVHQQFFLHLHCQFSSQHHQISHSPLSLLSSSSNFSLTAALTIIKLPPTINSLLPPHHQTSHSPSTVSSLTIIKLLPPHHQTSHSPVTVFFIIITKLLIHHQLSPPLISSFSFTSNRLLHHHHQTSHSPSTVSSLTTIKLLSHQRPSSPSPSTLSSH